ncbi:hypothetical protein [Actinacidiphila paucisporea]|uniref:Uncharacterized protein n=1 Tax=Actinacidiphila paucisporea TaxID=310782 RepID=A0A1M7Q898_9ACTN|nr:hypothetical protein [Actinacidiphila paucisporea]SHN26731.1 hypothetical protein SAMN05216499_13051 [Actinacidiphila paucisporea]
MSAAAATAAVWVPSPRRPGLPVDGAVDALPEIPELFVPEASHWLSTSELIAQELAAFIQCRPGIELLVRRNGLKERMVKYHLQMLRRPACWSGSLWARGRRAGSGWQASTC